MIEGGSSEGRRHHHAGWGETEDGFDDNVVLWILNLGWKFGNWVVLREGWFCFHCRMDRQSVPSAYQISSNSNTITLWHLQPVSSNWEWIPQRHNDSWMLLKVASTQKQVLHIITYGPSPRRHSSAVRKRVRKDKARRQNQWGKCTFKNLSW